MNDVDSSKSTGSKLGTQTGGIPAFPYYMPYFPRFWRQIKSLLASGYPVLMRLYPGFHYPAPEAILHKKIDREGHAVLLVGYDETQRVAIIEDPWNPDWGGARGGRTYVPYRLFEQSVVDNTLGFVDVVVPWTLDLDCSRGSGSRATVSCRLTYNCPEPLDSTRYVLSSVTARIALPDFARLCREEDPSRVRSVLAPRATWEFKWELELGAGVGQPASVEIRAQLSGAEPYEYTSHLGLRKEVSLERHNATEVHDTESTVLLPEQGLGARR